jgi:D-amino-acid oxidase
LIHKVAIIGAGIIGMTNAMLLLENGFDVTIFTKDDPLETNSDAAVATWFAPNDSKPLLQKYCLESLSKFDELIKTKIPGVQRIPQILYFKSEEDFKKSVWAKESVKKLVHLTDVSGEHLKIPDFPFSVLIQIPLVNPTIYRPYMLEKFYSLGGKLKKEAVASLTDLINDYHIVINSSGWEAKYLTQDPLVFPVRGQTEIILNTSSMKNDCSLNIEDLNAYIVFCSAKKGGDCVIGTTYQINDSDKGIRASDKQSIIKKVSIFFPAVKSVETVSKAGIRCGRPDVRIEKEINEQKSVIIHCYGHGGSGFSASWGSAYKVLEHAKEFACDESQGCRPEL